MPEQIKLGLRGHHRQRAASYTSPHLKSTGALQLTQLLIDIPGKVNIALEIIELLNHESKKSTTIARIACSTHRKLPEKA